MSIYPIETKGRTRWIAYNADDARGIAACLVTAAINFTMTYGRPTPETEQWTFDRT